jgi:hypothetical protein
MEQFCSMKGILFWRLIRNYIDFSLFSDVGLTQYQTSPISNMFMFTLHEHENEHWHGAGHEHGH